LKKKNFGFIIEGNGIEGYNFGKYVIEIKGYTLTTAIQILDNGNCKKLTNPDAECDNSLIGLDLREADVVIIIGDLLKFVDVISILVQVNSQIYFATPNSEKLNIFLKSLKSKVSYFFFNVYNKFFITTSLPKNYFINDATYSSYWGKIDNKTSSLLNEDLYVEGYFTGKSISTILKNLQCLNNKNITFSDCFLNFIYDISSY